MDYRRCRRCRLEWVEYPWPAPRYERCGVAAAGLAALQHDHPARGPGPPRRGPPRSARGRPARGWAACDTCVRLIETTGGPPCAGAPSPPGWPPSPTWPPTATSTANCHSSTGCSAVTSPAPPTASHLRTAEPETRATRCPGGRAAMSRSASSLTRPHQPRQEGAPTASAPPPQGLRRRRCGTCVYAARGAGGRRRYEAQLCRRCAIPHGTTTPHRGRRHCLDAAPLHRRLAVDTASHPRAAGPSGRSASPGGGDFLRVPR